MRSIIIGAAVLTTLAAPLVAAPAYAGASGTSRHYLSGDADCSDNLRNRGHFNHVSDDLTSYDDCEDGWGADTEIGLETGRYERCYNTKGNGTSKTCPFDFGEGKLGQILARSLDNGQFRSSGNVVYIVT